MRRQKRKNLWLPRKRTLHFIDNIRSPIYRHRWFSCAKSALHNMWQQTSKQGNETLKTASALGDQTPYFKSQAAGLLLQKKKREQERQKQDGQQIWARWEHHSRNPCWRIYWYWQPGNTTCLCVIYIYQEDVHEDVLVHYQTNTTAT